MKKVEKMKKFICFCLALICCIFGFVGCDCDNKESLLAAVKNARKHTDSQTLGPKNKKIKRHVFSYQDTENGVAITVYPGKSGEQ